MIGEMQSRFQDMQWNREQLGKQIFMYIVWITTCAQCAQIQTNAFCPLEMSSNKDWVLSQVVVEMVSPLYFWVALLFLVMIGHVYILLVTKVTF
jgi:hypothetical protein